MSTTISNKCDNPPPDTTPATTTTTPTTTQSKISLPALPFELQAQILSQIPLWCLFGLRRTSQAWNAMLSNPHLLEYICNHRPPPYLSSAPSLVSQLKRRLRMRLNKPVWVKSLDEAFPWARIPEPVPTRAPWRRLERYWNGWLAVIIEREPYNQEAPSNIEEYYVGALVLKIGHVGRAQKSLVEIDLIKSVREKFPQVEECLNENTAIHGVPYDKCFEVEKYELEEGKVLVSVTLSSESWATEGTPFRAHCLLIFDLSGAIVFHASLPTSPEPYLILRCNSTHLVTMHVNLKQNPRYRPDSGLCPTEAIFTINTYSLASGEKIKPEITVRRLQGSWIWTIATESDLDLNQYSNYCFGFDDSGMIWFPRFHNYELEFFCKENDKVMVWKPGNLPLSPCGGWVVFSALHGFPRESAGVFSSVSWEEEQEKEETHPWELPGPLFREVPDSLPNLLLTKFAGTNIKVSVDPTNKDEYCNQLRRGKSYPNIPRVNDQVKLIFQKWKSKAGYSSSVSSTITIPAKCFSELTRQYRYSRSFQNTHFNSPTATHKGLTWGYIGTSGHGNLAELTQTLDLLPYNDGQGEALQHDICNGIPQDAWQNMASPRSLYSGGGELVPHSEAVAWRWGDDGIICWGIGRRLDYDRRPLIPVQAWVVCYNEEWVSSD